MAELPVTVQNAHGEVIFAGDLAAPKPDLLPQARALVVGTGKASVRFLQRKLGISWNDGSALMIRLQQEGVVGAPDRAGHRQVLACSVELDEPEPLAFADPAALRAAVTDTLAFAQGLALAEQSLPDDALVRRLLQPGAEALLYALGQLREPTEDDVHVRRVLDAWLDDLIDAGDDLS